MITVAIVVLGIFLYVGIGIAAAIWDAPRVWAAARARWTMEQHVRGDVNVATACMILFWPFRVPYAVTMRRVLAADPAQLQKQVEEHLQRVKQLERELGIGR